MEGGYGGGGETEGEDGRLSSRRSVAHRFVSLRLGNVQFGEDDSGNSTVPDEGVTEFIAYLMEVEKHVVNKVLTTKVMETQRGGRRGELRALVSPMQQG